MKRTALTALTLLLACTFTLAGESPVSGHKDCVQTALQPTSAMESGVIHLRDSLQNFLHAVRTGRKATVAFLGGSITEMKGWHDMVKEELALRFPDTEFTYIDAGISSLGSTPHAFRFGKDVLSQGVPDLLFVEAAVNDDTNGFGPREQVLGMEGIFRQALAANPMMDIIMLDFIYEPFIPILEKGSMPEVIINHEKVAAHYGVCSINCAQDISDRLRDSTLTWEQFGGTHPAPAGHRLYTDAIMLLLDRCREVSSTPLAHPVPYPIDTLCYEHASLHPISEASGLDGFKAVEAWTPLIEAGTRRGFVDVPMLSSDDGGSFEFGFDGQAVGIFCVCGPDSGEIRYSIDGGEMRTLTIRTNWSRTLYIPWLYILDDSLPCGRHTLHVEVPEGQGCHIRDFAVNNPMTP